MLQFVMPPSAATTGDRSVGARGSLAVNSSSSGMTLPPVHLDAFDGPLDLLLHLVRAGRMDIFDLPILTLCDQYVTYLSSQEALDLNVAGEFLVMAATLLEIKSRLLLPVAPNDAAEEEAGNGDQASDMDPRAELVQRLLEYGKYQEIAEALKGAEADRRRVFFRAPTEYSGKFAAAPGFGEMSADALLRALQRILASAGAGERTITSVRRQKITLRMKMHAVLGLAERAAGEGIALEEIVPEPPFAAIEVVLIFLALLELIKIGSLVAAQDTFCGEIRIFFVLEAARDSQAGGGRAGGGEAAVEGNFARDGDSIG